MPFPQRFTPQRAGNRPHFSGDGVAVWQIDLENLTDTLSVPPFSMWLKKITTEGQRGTEGLRSSLYFLRYC